MADTPEIKIGADLSAVEKAVDDLGKKVVEVSKPIDVATFGQAVRMQIMKRRPA